eukprot:gnl/Trimastix_PCT/3565.p3 GENE.gnl/Trimastix_PCT/3565~~gnl/Trimastix_PCT/3565.p3  ORF type:complete len:170 (+),score=41.63 gnl/Trimastix_PCT/3565:614-1123(+)
MYQQTPNLMDARELQLLRQMFSRYDRDRDGYWSVADIRLALRALGRKTTRDTLRDIVWEVDGDGDGRLVFEDLVQMFCRVRAAPLSHEPTRLLNVVEFLMHDPDGSGTISIEDCVLLLSRRFSREITQADIHHFMIDVGSTADSHKRLSFSEFLRQLEIARMLRESCAS